MGYHQGTERERGKERKGREEGGRAARVERRARGEGEKKRKSTTRVYGE